MQYLLDEPVHGAIGAEKYKMTISWRNGTFISDEQEKSGGKDLGPDPYTLLLSSLATCTLATLRMYIDRKEWKIDDITVNTNLYKSIVDTKVVTTIDRDIRFISPVTEEQRIRLTEIASACPISKILQGEIQVRTFAHSDADTEKKLTYSNGDISIIWKPDLCKHSARCVSGLPGVFNSEIKPWINPHNATSQEIIDQVNKCPTGALSYVKNEKK